MLWDAAERPIQVISLLLREWERPDQEMAAMEVEVGEVEAGAAAAAVGVEVALGAGAVQEVGAEGVEAAAAVVAEDRRLLFFM